MDEYSGYRRKRKNDNSLVVHISLKKIKLSSPIKENAKIKAPKLLATGRSSTEAAQSIDNDSKHSASSEKRFKTKAEMKVYYFFKICVVMYWNVWSVRLSLLSTVLRQQQQLIAVRMKMKYIH